MRASVTEPIAQLPAALRAFARAAGSLAIERSVLDGDSLPQTPFESVAAGDGVAAFGGRVAAVEIVDPEPVVTSRHAMCAMPIGQQCEVRTDVAVVRRVAHQ